MNQKSSTTLFCPQKVVVYKPVERAGPVEPTQITLNWMINWMIGFHMTMVGWDCSPMSQVAGPTKSMDSSTLDFALLNLSPSRSPLKRNGGMLLGFQLAGQPG